MVSARRGLKVRNLTKTCIALERHVLGVQTYFARHQKRPLTLILNKFHFTLYQYLMQLFFCDTFTQRRGGRFRQTGMTGGKGNIIVGTVLGVLSGKYIFEEPLQHYWEAKRAEEAGTVTPTASDNAGKS